MKPDDVTKMSGKPILSDSFPILHHLISDPISSNSTDESVMDQILHPIPSVPSHRSMASGWLSSWSPTNWAASRPPRRARPRSSGRRRAAFYGCTWKGRMDSCCRWDGDFTQKKCGFNHWNTNEKWGSNGFYWNRWGFHPETLGFKSKFSSLDGGFLFHWDLMDFNGTYWDVER